MRAAPPLLRAPPFAGARASVSAPGAAGADPDPATLPDLFARVRAARVGGRFWLPPATLPHPGGTVVRDRRDRGEVDPWSVLGGASALVAHGDDEWVALACIAGVPVRVLSPGVYGAPGEDADALAVRAARALMAPLYRDPFTGAPADLATTIERLSEWRALIDANRRVAAACGIAWWKRAEIRRFLQVPGRRLRIVRRPARALALARRHHGAVAIWPSRVSPALIADAARTNVPLVRVEDGFVRSVGLGSALVPPASVVVDARGIHFDPSAFSDLEHILATTDFAPALLARAAALRGAIVAAGISKYAAGGDASPPPRVRPDKRLVLVPGQVEDDMSVLAGGGGLTSNLELLRRARALEPDAEIWFRPHPDVGAGHRKGAVADTLALAHADRVVREPGMAALLDTVDAVHVLTSLTGFEALLRHKHVTCHGAPFYAGWGLTRDLGVVASGRRGRALALDQLVAGVLILYPRYLDPVTRLPCPPEVLVRRMAEGAATNRLGWIAPWRRLQGRLMARLRSLA